MSGSGAPSLERPIAVDIESAGFKADPFPTLEVLRRAGPVIPVKLPFVGRTWLTTTHAATLAMVKDNTRFVQEARHAGKSGVVGMQWWMPRSVKILTNNMLLKDEPDHRRLRKLVDRAFQRRDVQAMRERIERVADDLLDHMGKGRADLLGDYARRLPLEVICDLLGLPEEDREVFSDRTRRAMGVERPIDAVMAFGAIGKLVDYIRVQIEEARRHPRPGLISELVRAEDDGDKLNAEELVSMIFLLLVAGFETTTHLISGSFQALERNPDQKAWLLADPAARMERAVEELARYVSPVQMTKPRHVAQDCDLFGQPLRRGDVIMAMLASANADPAVFDAPDRLRLDRFPNPHLVFSSGIHFCLGMQLARVETQSALTRFYARHPVIELPEGLDWIERIGIRGVRALPVQLSPEARAAA